MRARPSIAVAIALMIAYWIVSTAIQASAGIPYADWFKTGANAWRVGVASLAACTVLLVACVAMLRWDHLWRDPVKLPTTPLMTTCLWLWWAAIATRLVGVKWGEIPMDLLVPVVASGILVGFAEETLFRGFFLRGLREGGRPESSAAIWTAVAFGLFHLPNVFMGTGLIGLVQIVLAGLSGLLLYLFRRRYQSIVPAMVAHGTWDISTFLAGGYATEWLNIANIAMQLVFVGLAIAVIVSIRRNVKSLVAIPAG